MKTIIALLLLFISFSSQGIILGNQATKMINQSPLTLSPGFINQGSVSSPFINQTPILSQGFIKTDPMNVFIKQSPTMIQPTPIGIKANPMLINQIIQPQTMVPFPQPIYSQPIYTQPILTPINPMINNGLVTTTTMILPINATTARIVYPYNYVEQCRVSGLYKHLCLRQSDTTNYINTIFHKRYDCLKDAVCSFRAGKCQWLQTTKFKKCLRNYTKLGYVTYRHPMSTFPTTFLGEHY